jgi:hypothetical protein
MDDFHANHTTDVPNRAEACAVLVDWTIRGYDVDRVVFDSTAFDWRKYMADNRKATNRTYKAQKAGLTRAVNSGSPATVRAEVQRTVDEWNSQEWADTHKVRRGAWPDDWSRWNRALLDMCNTHIDSL